MTVERLVWISVGNFWFWIAFALYGLAAFLWIYILSQVSLSKALPFASLAFVITPLISRYVFGEQVHIAYWGGVALIILGVVITVAKAY